MRHFYLIILLAFSSIQSIACDANISPSDTICFEPGGSYPVTFTGSGGTAPYTFVYSVNGGAPQTITSNGTDDFATLDVPMTVIGNTHYTLISVTDANGCTVTVNESSDILTIINPSYMVSGTTTVLQNSTPFPGFTFSASGGVQPYTFYYTLNGGPLQSITSAPGSNSAFLPISTAVVGVYTVNLSSAQSPVNCPNITPPVITTSTATITVIPVPMVVSGSNQTVCAGAASANATFTASGSAGPYTYTYTVGGVTQTITGGSPISIPASTSPAGSTTYTLNGITDAYGNYQTVSATSTVTVLPAPSGTIFFGGLPCDHYSLTLTASGGSGPFVYHYTVNGTPMTASGGSSISINGPSVFGPTSYTISGVSVTNAAGCTGPLGGGGTIPIQPYYGNNISVTSTSVCVNGPSPVVTFSTLGGSSPSYTFYYNVNFGPYQTVNSGMAFATVNVPTTTAGTFVYTLTGTGGMCNFGVPVSVSVVVKPLPTATISGTASVCKNGASPTVTFTGANGTAPYTFTYKINGGANQTISSGAGSTATINVPTSTTGTFTYSLVSVSSAAGCTQNQTGSAVITVNPLPTATIAGTTTSCQNAASPLITFTGAGASAPYTFSYTINGGATQTISSGSASTVTLSVPTSSSGTFTYNLLSVSSAAGCSQAQTGSATVTINPVATAGISGTTTVCQNTASPAVTFTGANGTVPYTFSYNINGGATQTISSGSSSTATITVPTGSVGTFTYNILSVSSANGCAQTQSGSAIVTINSTPSASISGTATLCENDTEPVVTFTGTNGTAPYTFSYNVNGGATQTISSGSGSTATINVPTNTSGVFTYNLLSVSNANACSQTQTGSAVVTIHSMPTAAISGTVTLCQNDLSPVIIFTGSNSTAPYTFSYTINGGATQTISSGSSATATITVPTNIPGTFTYDLLSVSSANGCSQTQSESAVVTINSTPSASISGTATLCENDTEPVVTFTGTNGTAPYTFSYNVNGGATQTISSGSGSTAILNVPTNTSGVFTYNLLSVSNANTCSQAQTGSAVVTIHSMPTAAISGTITLCQNDLSPVITFTGSNSTAPYTFSYTINGGSVQTISSGSSATATIPVPTNIPGTFTYDLLSVSSTNGCSQAQTVSAVVTINSTPSASISGTATLCENDTEPVVTFTGTNGTAPYTFSYNVNGGATQTISSGSASTATINVPTSTSGVFTYNLLAVSDGGSCSQNQGGLAIITVNEAPTATIAGNSTVCQNNPAQISFEGFGGTGPYIFSYTVNGGPIQTISSGSGTTAQLSVLTINATNYVYTLDEVSDVNGCSQNPAVSAGIAVNEQPVLAGITPVCEGTSVQLTAGGNSSVVSWNSSNPSVASISNSGLLTTISPGSTTITCTNSDGCSDSQTVQVLAAATAAISGNTTICEGNTAVFTISGTPNASVSYTDGISNFTTTIPASGSIAITSPVLNDTTIYTLSNAQSTCSQSVSGSIEIDVTPIPVMGTMNDLTVCSQDLVQVPAFNALTGTLFTWTNSNTSIGLAGSGTGAVADFTALNNQVTIQTGSVTVTPSLNGCAGSPLSFQINVNPLPVANAGADQAFCSNDGSLHVIGSAPVSGNSYSWSPAGNLNDPTVSNPSVLSSTSGQTAYVLTVTTSSGCQNTDTMLFTGIDSPVISLTASSQFACENGILNFHLDTSEQVTINWFVDGISLISNTNETDWSSGFESGAHTVYVIATNGSGCSSADTVSGGVLVYPGVNADFTTGLNSNHIDSFTDHIDLINESENATTYEWSFNGSWFSSETNPVVTFEPGNNFITIQLVAENDFGCSDTALLHIEPLSDGVVYVPNTFTPDGDQYNSLFFPVVSDDFDKENYLFEIYNRWGELIFSTTDVTEGWPGTYMGLSYKTDTYTWKLTLKSTKTDLTQAIVGHVNLLR